MPTRGKPREIGRRVDAAFADDRSCRAGTSGASRSLTASDVLNTLQIAVVDADQPRFQLQRALEFVLRRALRPARPCRGRALRLRCPSPPRRRAHAMMIEDAVGAHRARLRHLIGLEHEILAQRRQRGGRARRGQKFRPALERRRVGQHRQAGRAAGLIGARQRRRIEIGADQALRRARLLDLGDQRVVAARRASARSP